MAKTADDWTYELYRLAGQLGSEGVPDDEFFIDKGGPGPLFIVAGAARIAAEADNLIRMYVHQARRMGDSWDKIGEAIGVSRQAAHKRYA